MCTKLSAERNSYVICMFKNVSVHSKNGCLNVRHPYISRYKNDIGRNFDLVNAEDVPSSSYEFRSMTQISAEYTKSDANNICDGTWGKFTGGSQERNQRVPIMPAYKYVRKFSQRVKCVCETRYKLAILLPELHANLNIGHAAKDFVFLANMLSLTSPDAIIVEDRAASTGNLDKIQSFQTRRDLLHALIRNKSNVIFLQQNANPDFATYKTNMCFDHVVQKPLAWFGSKKGNQLLRSRIMEFCSIPKSIHQDIILFADHGKATDLTSSRRFAEQDILLKSLSSLNFACPFGCKITHASFSEASLCDQVHMYSRAKVVVAHHGANMANSMFMQPDSLVIEINKQCNEHIFSNAGYALLHATLGISYIGARVSYMNHQWYDFRSTKLIHVNFTKWDQVIKEAQKILHVSRSTISTLQK